MDQLVLVESTGPETRAGGQHPGIREDDVVLEAATYPRNIYMLI